MVFRSVVVFACLVAAWALAGHAAEFVFRDAIPGRGFAFPADHGKHPDFRTEWWYFTGNLESEKGQWGFQLTFFRRGLFQDEGAGKSAWRVRDLYPAHFALTDAARGRFFHTDLLSREGPGLAGAAQDDLDVYVKNWSARRTGDVFEIIASSGAHMLELTLAPQKPPVLHGDRGYSRKGDSESQASYYYSFTRLKAQGTLSFEGAVHRVTGHAWMDHEFGSSILQQDQVGWDWFSLQLDDGSELMVFRLRKKDGSSERPSGTLIPREGPAVDLTHERLVIQPTGSWASTKTKAVYPSGWKIEIPGRGIKLDVQPLIQDQELETGRSTQVVYWEGAAQVRGESGGKPVRGRGYVELTGYAHSMSGRL